MPPVLNLSRDFDKSLRKLRQNNRRIGEQADEILVQLATDPTKAKIEYLRGKKKYKPFKIKIGDHWRILGSESEGVINLLDIVSREEATRRYKEMTSSKFRPPAN